jgi:hypothetical protein
MVLIGGRLQLNAFFVPPRHMLRELLERKGGLGGGLEKPLERRGNSPGE